MQTILFPTDLSDAANQAYLYALQFAKHFDARIVTLHVFEKPEIANPMHRPATLERFYAEADLYDFENYKDTIPLLDQIATEHGLSDVAVTHSLIEGIPAATILAQADKEQADMIVLGTTGARGLQEVFIGSVAGEVLENANCPVLAVPAKDTFDGTLDNLGFSFAYQDEDIVALRHMLDIARHFGARVHAVHVDLAHTRDLADRLTAFKSKFPADANLEFHVIDGMDIEEALTTFIHEQRLDILAMVTHRRNFWQELFHFSRTKSMSYHQDTPILSFPVQI